MSFVRKNSEATVDLRNMFGAPGTANCRRILNDAGEMGGHGRLFNHVTLEVGGGIGWHIHHGDGECYYVLRGKGEYSDNGRIVPVETGDVTWVGDGEGHSLMNTGDEPMELIALILYA